MSRRVPAIVVSAVDDDVRGTNMLAARAGRVAGYLQVPHSGHDTACLPAGGFSTVDNYRASCDSLPSLPSTLDDMGLLPPSSHLLAGDGQCHDTLHTFSSSCARGRVVLKNGQLNLVTVGLSQLRRRFLTDIVTTLIDLPWPLTLFLVAMCFVISWLVFGVGWWLFSLSTTELDHHFAAANSTRRSSAEQFSGSYQTQSRSNVFQTAPNRNISSSSHTRNVLGQCRNSSHPCDPSRQNSTEICTVTSQSHQSAQCIVNVHGFVGAFLFSVETQQAIGYGRRHVGDSCGAVPLLLLCLQAVAGLAIHTLLVLLLAAKMARPSQRAHTLLFSKHAVVCLRDGRLSVMFRVASVQPSSLLDATLRAFVVRRSREAGSDCPQLVELSLGGSTRDSCQARRSVLFLWPLTVVHVVDRHSPLFHVRAADVAGGSSSEAGLELLVVLEGSAEATAMLTQARSSYLPGEILWGHRLPPTMQYDRHTGRYMVDWRRFHETHAVSGTPLCSAAELHVASAG